MGACLPHLEIAAFEPLGEALLALRLPVDLSALMSPED